MITTADILIEEGVAHDALAVDDSGRGGDWDGCAPAPCRHLGGSAGALPGYLTTEEAARYMRRSVSWMLRRKDIPYYRGKPNLYRRQDLDEWLRTTRRHEPLAI